MKFFISGLDIDYQTSHTIAANWAIRDHETSTDYCVWAIGESGHKLSIEAMFIMEATIKFIQERMGYYKFEICYQNL